MQIDRQHFMDNGYLIVRGAIPPESLDRLRASYETLVDRQRAAWKEAGTETWEKGGQPRLVFQQFVDESTADAVDFCLGDSTLGVCQQLMQTPDAAVVAMFFMCSPQEDHGPANWHRDIGARNQAPLHGIQRDLLDNAPGYIQWNIPLYDDRVLWVVPGSHKRPNTPEEREQFRVSAKEPMPGAIRVELAAGDAVCYSNSILHWGSDYSTTHRRTIHLGYRSFGGPIYPHVHHFYWDLGFTQHLSDASRKQFERWDALHRQERDLIESILRAVLRGDTEAFRSGLARLHPGEQGRMVATVLLYQLVRKSVILHDPETAALSLAERATAIQEAPSSQYQYEDIAHRFTVEECDALSKRFAGLAEALAPDAQLDYMPDGFGLDEFVASW